MVAMYEAGETQYLDLLLKSNSISDFLSSYYVISEIAQYDSELLQDIEEKRKTIDTEKQKLENSKKGLAVLVEGPNKITRTLQNTKN